MFSPARRVVVAIVGASLAVTTLGIVPAAAHQSPGGCNSNSVDITPTRDRLLVRNGDVINYTVSIRNVSIGNQAACDLTNATVTLTLPGADGTPSGTKVVLASGADVPAGTSKTFPGTTPYTVAVNPGVADAVAKAQVSGTLHDAPVDHNALIEKTLGTTVTQPHTTLAVSASPSSGRVPLPVTYTYTEKNDSSTAAPISNVSIVDSNCAPVTYKSGDTNNDQILDVNEVWTYTCTKTITTGGVVTNNVVGKGTNTVDNKAAPDELASVTATYSQPSSILTETVAPASGVAPLNVVFTYVYENNGKDGIKDLKVTADNCTPLTLVSGDTNNNGIVDVGEKWTYTCPKTLATPSTVKDTSTAIGTSVVDNQPVPTLTATAQAVATAPAVVNGSTTTTTAAPAAGTPVTPASPSTSTGSAVAGNNVAAAPARTSPTVLGVTASRPRVATPRATGTLPMTGKTIGMLVVGGLVATSLGLLIVALNRRKTAEA